MQDRLYRYVNENDIRMSPKYFVIDGKVFTNPSKEKQREQGYIYDFENTPYPETEEGYTRDFKFIINGLTIVRHWSEPIPIEAGDEE